MEFRKKDVIKLRVEWDRKSKKKIEMRKWVLSRIVDEMGKGMEEIDDDDDEVFGLPPWQEYTRNVANNLGL